MVEIVVVGANDGGNLGGEALQITQDDADLRVDGHPSMRCRGRSPATTTTQHDRILCSDIVRALARRPDAHEFTEVPMQFVQRIGSHGDWAGWLAGRKSLLR